jgi:hypothetical protein
VFAVTKDEYAQAWRAGRDAAAEVADEKVVPVHQGGGIAIESRNMTARSIAATIRALEPRIPGEVEMGASESDVEAMR